MQHLAQALLNTFRKPLPLRAAGGVKHLRSAILLLRNAVGLNGDEQLRPAFLGNFHPPILYLVFIILHRNDLVQKEKEKLSRVSMRRYLPMKME